VAQKRSQPLGLDAKMLHTERKPSTHLGGSSIADMPAAPDNVKSGAHRVSRRNSRRASAAKIRRSTMLLRRDRFDDEIDKIVESVEEGSPSYQDDTATTPKHTKGGTAGILLSTVKRSVFRPSFDIEGAANVVLPKLRLSRADEYDIHMGSPPEGGEERADVTDLAGSRIEGNMNEENFYEGHSVTLREILIKAGNGDVAQFGLLEDEEEPDDGAFEWD